jgi:hypothetical protein
MFELLSGLSGQTHPSFDNGLQRFSVQVVKLVSAHPFGPYETGRLEDVQVLRDRLARQAQAVLHHQSSA